MLNEAFAIFGHAYSYGILLGFLLCNLHRRFGT